MTVNTLGGKLCISVLLLLVGLINSNYINSSPYPKTILKRNKTQFHKSEKKWLTPAHEWQNGKFEGFSF